MKLDFHHKFFGYLVNNCWLDYWTATHMAAGAFICKVALWCGASDLWAVLLSKIKVNDFTGTKTLEKK